MKSVFMNILVLHVICNWYFLLENICNNNYICGKIIKLNLIPIYYPYLVYRYHRFSNFENSIKSFYQTIQTTYV